MVSSPPTGTRRLLPEGVDLSTSPSEVVARLLEDGDREDLRWLIRELGPESIRKWLVEHGLRALSARSLAFWRSVFALEVSPPDRIAAELWPAYGRWDHG